RLAHQLPHPRLDEAQCVRKAQPRLQVAMVYRPDLPHQGSPGVFLLCAREGRHAHYHQVQTSLSIRQTVYPMAPRLVIACPVGALWLPHLVQEMGFLDRGSPACESAALSRTTIRGLMQAH